MADYRNDPALAGNDSIVPRASVAVDPWRVLIVGNDKDLHSTTAFTLKAVQVEKRPIELSHAYSVAQAYEMLQGGRGFAVILVDADIAPGDGSLKLVRHIRGTLKLTAVRIILRTGHPDHHAIIEAIQDFDTSDAVAKSTTDHEMHSVAVSSAISDCLKTLSIDSSRRELDRIVNTGSMPMTGYGLQELALGLLEQIGEILAIDADGMVFVCGQTPWRAGASCFGCRVHAQS
jgi:CheY-like chemotaxis protein